MENILNEIAEEFLDRVEISDDLVDMMQSNMLPMQSLMAYYRCAIMEVETKFRVLNEQFSLQYDRNPIETIKSRVKSYESILRKVSRKNIPHTLEAIEEQMTDIAGVRVICAFQEDIYLLERCLLNQTDVKLVRRKDYINQPKANGYRSLHLIIETPIYLEEGKRMMKVEVQFRTIAMDFWASLEHKLRYKKQIPESELQQISTELGECAWICANLDAKMQDIRDRIEAAKEDQGFDAEAANLEWIGNARYPEGEMGGRVLDRMNHSHFELTKWGTSYLPLGGEILDIGCGGGNALHYVASLTPNSRLTGVDYSEVAAKKASEWNNEYISQGRMQIVKGSVSALPFSDESFDTVYSVESYYFWPDLEKDLQEVRRVLRPGGMFMIIAEMIDGQLDEKGEQVRKLLNMTILDEEGLSAVMRAAGFRDIFVRRSDQGGICVRGTK